MNKKVVVMGGGTGTFTVLTGLKEYELDLTAVVAMSDDGGSTGTLRDELGVLPPGDVRQCLVALSKSDRLMRDLMNYRFSEGGLGGHNFGNLFLSALEKVTGSFDAAVEKASEVLRIEGQVIPATLNDVSLAAHLRDGSFVRGEANVFSADMMDYQKIFLEPEARANPKALRALREADAIVIGPGDLYSSLIPNLLIKGIPEAIKRSKATKIYVCNLMNRPKHTDYFTVRTFTDKIESYIGSSLDYVIYNNRNAPAAHIETYKRQGEYPVSTTVNKDGLKSTAKKFFGTSLINRRVPKVKAGDKISRTLIRHNPKQLAKVIVKLIGA